MQFPIIDTPDDVEDQIAHLRANGTKTVIRYLTSTRGSPKLIGPVEARKLAAAGIRVAVVYEVYGGADGVADIDAAHGAADAAFCLKYLPTIGAPDDGSVIVFFACDTDFSASDIKKKVLPYFDAIYDAFASAGHPDLAGDPYRVGVYGSGAVCEAVCAAVPGSRAFLSGSMGWTDSRAYLARRPKELVLVQDEMDVRLANVDADTDYAMGAIGDFLPFAGGGVTVSQRRDPAAAIQDAAMVHENLAKIRMTSTPWRTDECGNKWREIYREGDRRMIKRVYDFALPVQLSGFQDFEAVEGLKGAGLWSQVPADLQDKLTAGDSWFGGGVEVTKSDLDELPDDVWAWIAEKANLEWHAATS